MESIDAMEYSKLFHADSFAPGNIYRRQISQGGIIPETLVETIQYIVENNTCNISWIRDFRFSKIKISDSWLT